MKRKISVIIPAYNEERNVGLIYLKLKSVLDRQSLFYEIIFVDDGSTDLTYKELKKIRNQDNAVKIIKFRRNFGQTAAISAGFDYSQGEVVVVLDADLQNDPADIPKLLTKLKEGYDVVSGWRKNRKDDFLSRRLPSQIANYLISRISGIKLHDYGCSLKVYRKEILKDIKLYGEMHRYIPAIAASVGAKVGEVEVKHYRRKYGKSKYGLGRTFRVVLDLLVIKYILSYQVRPIQLFGKIGLIVSSLGSFIFGILVFERLFENQPLSSRPLFTISIFMVLVGMQFITIGLMAEVVVMSNIESQNKKTYFIKEKLF